MLVVVVTVTLGAEVAHLHITSRVHLAKLTGAIFIRDLLCFDH